LAAVSLTQRTVLHEIDQITLFPQLPPALGNHFPDGKLVVDVDVFVLR